jgi:hypothetical protein
MIRLLFVLVLAGCGSSYLEPPCVPDELGYGCHDMSGDATTDTLLTWPDSIDPSTGLPYPASSR